jgi:PAS domain S-box-containing protein
MLKKLSVKSKVLVALLGLTLITASGVAIIAAMLGISTLTEESFKKLTAVRELKANQIEHYFKSIDDQVRNHSRGREMVEAMMLFNRPAKDSAHPIESGGILLNQKKFIESFGFGNLYLVDNKTGRILYSVYRDIDPGTSLTVGVYSDTYLARAFKKAAATDDPDFSWQTDFEHFGPSDGKVCSFISTPVFDGARKIGVLIYQIPVEWINDIMTDKQNWGNMGLGKTGETYLSGEDSLIRNQSRFFIEDPSNYFRMIRLAGVPPETISRIRKSHSTILMQPVSMEETKLALQGESGTGIIRDYRGVRTLTAYKHLNLKNLKWLIISKIDRNEVLVAIPKLFRKFALYIALLLCLVITFSMIFARDLSRPVEELAIANDQLKTLTAAIRSAANSIIITDPKGIVKWVNPAFTRLTGYGFDEIVGNRLKMLNSGVQSPEFFKNMWSRILAGEVWHDEVVNKRKDGSLYTEEMTITPVRDSFGMISQFVAIKQDITERKRLEQILKSAHERMEEELNVARDIQMSMLPLNFPAFPDRKELDVYAKLIPAREVGGDFYDFYFIDKENFCFVVGDVSGKGVPAALIMAVTKTLIKAAANNVSSTARILTLINHEISPGNENSAFITVFIGILNTTTGLLVYTNAGHNPSYVLRKDGTIPEKLSTLHGVAIGAVEGMEYRESVLQLNPGDAIFAYTDGVTEAQNPDGKLFTGARLAGLLRYAGKFESRELVDRVLEDIHRYEEGAEHADDITMLNVRFQDQPKIR